MPEVPAAPAPWLLLVHQLPVRPSNLRVHTWRRLQQVGAVALRNALYVLPNTPESREDFDWIRTEIAARGGQVSVLMAEVIDGYTDDDLRATFRDARASDYRDLIRDVDALAGRVARSKTRLARVTVQRQVAKVRERFLALKAIDFFGSPPAAEAQSALDRLERAFVNEPVQRHDENSERLDPRFFRRRQWLTRPRPGIDRMASAWLIRRFIAPDATFVFGPLPAREGQIPFDMPDVEFGHHATDCTYETLVRRFAISDPAAVRLGHVVHDLDLKESRYGLPDTATIGRLVEGIREAGTSDDQMLEQGIAMIEALYRSFVSDARSPTPRTRIAAKRPARRRRGA
jgi:hypothetical protein